jgi:hypothetical protein
MSTGLGAALLDLNDRLQEYRGKSEAEKSLMRGQVALVRKTGRGYGLAKDHQTLPI